jgi:hypothetical protein
MFRVFSQHLANVSSVANRQIFKLLHHLGIYFHFFEIFIIQIGKMAFCKPEFLIIKSNYFQSAQKAFALVREYRFRTLLCGREMSF